jgi:hypothetical protein
MQSIGPSNTADYIEVDKLGKLNLTLRITGLDFWTFSMSGILKTSPETPFWTECCTTTEKEGWI